MSTLRPAAILGQTYPPFLLLYTLQLFDTAGHGHPVLPLAVHGAAVHLGHEEVF
jgi:hypothetical protein